MHFTRSRHRITFRHVKCDRYIQQALINIHRQQVASLVAKPIEVVEDQTQSCKCLECGGELLIDIPHKKTRSKDILVSCLKPTSGFRQETKRGKGLAFIGDV